MIHIWQFLVFFSRKTLAKMGPSVKLLEAFQNALQKAFNKAFEGLLEGLLDSLLAGLLKGRTDRRASLDDIDAAIAKGAVDE